MFDQFLAPEIRCPRTEKRLGQFDAFWAGFWLDKSWTKAGQQLGQFCVKHKKYNEKEQVSETVQMEMKIAGVQNQCPRGVSYNPLTGTRWTVFRRIFNKELIG